jgi:hypothetical protein
MLVLFVLAGMGVFMVAMHQGAISNDLRSTRLEQKISAEKTKQKSLRVSLARLKSPGRVTLEATDELGLSEPSAVIYLKYTKDSNGNIACQSNYETTAKETPKETGQKEPQESAKKQASVKTEIPANMTQR